MLRKNSNTGLVQANTAAYMINYQGMCRLQMHVSNDKWLITSIRILYKNSSALLDSISIIELCSAINSTVATVHESFTSQH